jgi:hypothetical protein
MREVTRNEMQAVAGGFQWNSQDDSSNIQVQDVSVVASFNNSFNNKSNNGSSVGSNSSGSGNVTIS